VERGLWPATRSYAKRLLLDKKKPGKAVLQQVAGGVTRLAAVFVRCRLHNGDVVSSDRLSLLVSRVV